MEDHETIIANDEVLNAGVASSTTDGVTTNYDLDFLQRRQRHLQRRYQQKYHGKSRHPFFSQQIRISGGCE